MATLSEAWIAENPGGAGALESALTFSPPDADSTAIGSQGVWWGPSVASDAVVARILQYYQPVQSYDGGAFASYQLNKLVQKFFSDPSRMDKSPEALLSEISGTIEPIGTQWVRNGQEYGEFVSDLYTVIRGPEPPGIRIILGDLLIIWGIGTPAQTPQAPSNSLVVDVNFAIANPASDLTRDQWPSYYQGPAAPATVQAEALAEASKPDLKGDLAFFALAAVLVLTIFIVVPKLFRGASV